MKLLFDHNLSPKLVQRLVDLYPASDHVWNLGLEEAADVEIWDVARKGGFWIVSKDSDFSDIAAVQGFPPRVLWIRRGNCSTRDIEQILRRDHALISAVEDEEEVGVLMLY